MKKYLSLFLTLATAALAQPTNVQKTSGTNAITGNLVIGAGRTLSATGGGTITATSVPSTGITGTTLVANGGTGATTLTAHGVVVGNGTSAVAVTTAGTAGQVLTSNGASADPTFQSAGSGSGTVTHTAGALTANAVMLGNGTDDSKALASLGTSGQVLTSNGAGVPPSFQTGGGGGGGVNSGTATQLAYYASTGSTVDSTPAFTIGASGNPAVTAGGSNQNIVLTPSGTGGVKVTGSDATILWDVGTTTLTEMIKFRPITANSDGGLLISPSGTSTESALYLTRNSSPDTTGANTFGFGGGFAGAEAGYWNFGAFNRSDTTTDAPPISFSVQNAVSGRIHALHILKTGQVDILQAITSSSTSTGSLTVAGGVGIAGRLNVGGQISGIGTVAGDDAAAGSPGESVISTIASGSAVSLSTGTGANVTSISLTAGDWDVTGNINFAATTATVTGTVGSISPTPNTIISDGTEVYSGVQVTLLSETDSVTLPKKRVNVTATTTIYLVGKSTFSAGSIAAFGNISARRIR